MVRGIASIVFAAALVAAAGGAKAQQRGGDETPDQNVRQSQQYESLACSNQAFRAKRIAQECGPLQGSSFYDNCVASFNCGGARPSGENWRNAPPSQTMGR
jgi:hypothetical protein